VTALVSGLADRPTFQAAAREGALSADAARTLKGRLVHRLLQFSGEREAGDDLSVESLADALLRREELIGVDDVSGTVAEATRLFKVIRDREEFSTRRSDDCFFEVPLSFRRSGDATVLRGTVDCLARAPDGSLTVFEFKTGRPSPDHRAQLDVYVAAIRALFSGTRVEGQLIYS
jgi:ATP-dependent exoDNAse (exonuclease V) beta subunit